MSVLFNHVLAGHPSVLGYPPRSRPRWHPKTYRLAQVSAQLCDHADGERREREGCAATHALANCRCTLEIYSQARIQATLEAQHRVIEMISPREERQVIGITEPFKLAKSESAGVRIG